MGLWADRLIAELEDLKAWPAPAQAEDLRTVSRCIALRDRDEDTLRAMAGWHEGRNAQRKFIRDPMPSRITAAYGALIFGRRPQVTTASPADKERMAEIVKGNNLRSALRRAHRIASSEGEVWWRASIQRDVADVPLVDWYSRTFVYPLYAAGGRLMAVAFITREDDLGADAYRLFEVHEVVRGAGGRVEWALFRLPGGAEKQENQGPGGKSVTVDTVGRGQGVGERVDLSEHPDTEDLPEEWTHGLPMMLAGRIQNREGTNPELGVSDYFDSEDYLVSLSVVSSIAQANLDLTARKRVIVPEDQVHGEEGAIDVGEQVFTETAAMPGEGTSSSPWRVLEYSFDAEALVTFRQDQERLALTRSGIDVQFAGGDVTAGNAADTGIALRTRLIPSEQSADERGMDFDDRIPTVLLVLQLLDALAGSEDLPPGEFGGFGRPWQSPDEEPEVDRGATLPEDRAEATERRVSAVAGHIMSRRTAIEEDHENWDPNRVQQELDEIEEESKTSSPFGGGTIVPRDANPDDIEDPATPAGSEPEDDPPPRSE